MDRHVERRSQGRKRGGVRLVLRRSQCVNPDAPGSLQSATQALKSGRGAKSEPRDGHSVTLH